MKNDNKAKSEFPTIAWDVDDVLNELMRTWLNEWWKPQHPNCQLNYEDIQSNPPHQLLGVEIQSYLKSLDQFRQSEHYKQMAPDNELMTWFLNHGHCYRHLALTAVPRIAAPRTAEWVIRHFGRWIRSFHFIPSVRPHEMDVAYDASKAAYLKWLNRVDIFIDDHEKNVRAAQDVGICAYLVSRPWNSGKMKLRQILSEISASGDSC